MERKVNIEEVRHFLAAIDKQFVEGGIVLQAVRFKRNEDNSVNEIVMTYEEWEVTSSDGKEAQND